MVFDADINNVSKVAGALLRRALEEAKRSGLQVEGIDISIDTDDGDLHGLSIALDTRKEPRP